MRQVAAVLLLTVSTFVTGCAVTGKWSLTKVEPEAARRDFEYASLTLQKDGSFYAESQEPRIRTTSGTYTFKDGTLTLMPHEGPRVAYDAVQPDADHLRLVKTFDGQKVKTEFKRIE